MTSGQVRDSIDQKLVSDKAVAGLCISIALSLFLPSGFISVSVIALFVYSLFTFRRPFLFRVRRNFPLFLPVLLVLLYLAGVLYAEDKRLAFDLVVRKAPLLIIPLAFILCGIPIRRRILQPALVAFVIFCTGATLICLATAAKNVYLTGSLSLITIDREYYYFSYILLADAVNMNPIYLSLFCCFALVIALDSPSIRNLVLRIALVFYLCVFIMLLASKIGIVCMVAVLVIWFLMQQKKTFITRFFVVALIVAVPFSIWNFSFLKDRFTTSLEFDYSLEFGHLWTSTAYRMAIWSSTVETLKESSVLGFGTSDGQKALEATYQKNGFVWGLRDRLNPHNQFFSTLLDIGVPGFAVLLAMVLVPFFKALGSRSFLQMGVVITMLFFFFVESIFLRQVGIVASALLYSISNYPALPEERNS